VFTGKIRAIIFIYTRQYEKDLRLKGRKILLKVGEMNTRTNLSKF
jgi:hypothetical protein